MTAEEYKAERRNKTVLAATALVEDLQFFRELLDQERIRAGDVRRATAQLRRLLVDGDLVKVAAPRVGKIEIAAPNHLPFHEYNKSLKYKFFMLAHASLFGVELAALCVVLGDSEEHQKRSLEFSPEARKNLSVELFVAQPVMILDGDWFSRREIIKYVANIGFGVHSGEKLDEREERLRRRRYAVSITEVMGEVTLEIGLQALTDDGADVISKDRIDAFLIEVLATMSSLVNSPDVQQLEEYIQRETSI